MANARIGALRVDLGMNTAAFEKGVTLAERRLNQFSKRMKVLGGQMKSLGQNLTLGLTLPLAAFGYKAAQAAIDAEEMQSAFEVVFGKMAGDVKKWAQETGDAMGRSTQEMQRGAMAFQELFGKSLPLDRATEMSKTFAVLAQDLASFKNLSNDVAQQKLFAGLTGESEPLKAVGVFINETAVKTKLLEMNVKKVNGAYTDQQKIMARAALIQEQLSQASGDVMRTSGSTANQIKTFDAAVEELSVSVGEKLLPAITPLVTAVAGLVDRFAKLPDGLQTAAVAFAAIAAAAGPLLFIFGTMLTQLPLLMAAAPWLAGLAAAGLLIYQNWDKVGPIFEDFGRGIGLLPTRLGGATDAIASSFERIKGSALAGGHATKEQLDKITDGIARMSREGVVDPKVTASITELIAKMEEAGDVAPEEADEISAALLRAFSAEQLDGKKSGWQLLGEDLRFQADRAIAATNDFIDEVGKLMTGDFSGIFEASKAALRIFFPDLMALAEKAKQWVGGMVTSIKSWIVDKLNAVWKQATDKIQTVKAAFYDLYDAVVGNSYVPDMVDGIAAHMARLDDVMVDKAKKTTAATKEAFGQMAAEVRMLLDRLYPEAAKLQQFKNDVALIEASDLTPEQKQDARSRLRFESMGIDRSDKIPMGFLEPEKKAEFKREASEFNDISKKMADNAKVQTVRIAESFKDMALKTIESVKGLVDSIKNGGFFDILTSLVDVVLQLGSTGLFGKGFANNINSTSFGGARAMGGPVSFGKSYLVGENGPELFTPGASGAITPNHGLGGQVQIVPSPYFDVVVDGRILRAAPDIAQAGGQVGISRLQQMNNRRLA